MQINVYTDGGSRGNPGPSGFGLVIYSDKNEIIYQESTFLGVKTNNEAEYSGLLAALKWILDNKTNYKLTQINFFADSQLMIRQLQGIYKVKSPNLVPFFTKAQKLITEINLPIKYQDIRRDFNKLADELANQAMDRKS